MKGFNHVKTRQYDGSPSVAVAQYDQLLPKAARRFAPSEFVPWVEGLLRAGHEVEVVYEACGFGFTLYRRSLALERIAT